ncbi:MAG: NAD-binding protein [Candidatus Hodarchaeota archaeon]
MVSKRMVKLGIALNQNKGMIMIIITWFIVNFLMLLIDTGDPLTAVALLFYVGEPSNGYQRFYTTYSEIVVFGLLVGLITVDALRNYDPKTTCSIMARKMKDHAIIIGYNHLGIRLDELLHEINMPHTVVSRDEEKLGDLFNKEEPAVVFDALDKEFPKKIAMNKARYIFLCENDLVFNLEMVVMAKKNPEFKGQIIVRCFEDDMAKIFKKYGAKTISTSSTTSKRVFDDELNDKEIKQITIIGFGHFAERVSLLAVNRSINNTIIEHRPERIEEMKEFFNETSEIEKKYISVVRGNPMDMSVLKEAGAFESDAVIITLEADDEVVLLVKDLKERNPDARIIARSFSDELEIIMEDMGAVMISTSEYALEHILKPILMEK